MPKQAKKNILYMRLLFITHETKNYLICSSDTIHIDLWFLQNKKCFVYTLDYEIPVNIHVILLGFVRKKSESHHASSLR